MKKSITEFKQFLLRGNVIDLAIGVVIGASFGKIVSSLVEDVLMPPIGLLTGGLDFSDFSLTLKSATEATPAVVIRYGAFFNTIIEFVIVAASIFVVVKIISKFRKEEEAKEKPPEANTVLLTEIRDLLKK